MFFCWSVVRWSQRSARILLQQRTVKLNGLEQSKLVRFELSPNEELLKLWSVWFNFKTRVDDLERTAVRSKKYLGFRICLAVVVILIVDCYLQVIRPATRCPLDIRSSYSYVFSIRRMSHVRHVLYVTRPLCDTSSMWHVLYVTLPLCDTSSMWHVLYVTGNHW